MMELCDLEWLMEVFTDERFREAVFTHLAKRRTEAVNRLVVGTDNDDRERGFIKGLDEIQRLVSQIADETTEARKAEKNS